MSRKYNLQEWFSVSSLPYASSQLALQAVLQSISERLKNVSCQVCLYDWFTPLSRAAMAFSVRLLAYPLRFVNLFDVQIEFFLFVSQHWYSFHFCVLSVLFVSICCSVGAFVKSEARA